MRHPKDEASPLLWRISETDGQVTVEFGSDKLSELREAFDGIAVGRGDFAIYRSEDEAHPEKQCLWFWCYGD
jgi:hypothetical protein